MTLYWVGLTLIFFLALGTNYVIDRWFKGLSDDIQTEVKKIRRGEDR